MDKDILALVGNISTPGFFVVSDIIHESENFPEGIEEFIIQKLRKINEGASARKFAFRSNGWQINFTFFPTDKVVEERYGLMNKMIKERKKIQ